MTLNYVKIKAVFHIFDHLAKATVLVLTAAKPGASQNVSSFSVCVQKSERGDPVMEVQIEALTDVRERVASERLTLREEKLDSALHSVQ